MSKVEDFYKVDIYHNGDFRADNKKNIQLIKGLANAKQAVFHRLITSKGSIVHRPNYGVGLKSYENGINSITKQRELALIIKEQIEQDFRVNKVSSIKIIEDNFISGQFTVTIKLEFKGYGDTTMSINPFSGSFQ